MEPGTFGGLIRGRGPRIHSCSEAASARARVNDSKTMAAAVPVSIVWLSNVILGDRGCPAPMPRIVAAMPLVLALALALAQAAAAAEADKKVGPAAAMASASSPKCVPGSGSQWQWQHCQCAHRQHFELALVLLPA